MRENDEIIRKMNAIIAKKMEFVDFGYMEFIYSKLPYIPFFHYLVAKDETCLKTLQKGAILPNSLKTRKAMKWTNIGASIARWSLPLLKKLLTIAKQTRFLRLK